MALTKERINEIAFFVLMDKMEHEGLPLKPKEVKRAVINNAKKSGIPTNEVAEFAKVMFEELYKKTIAEFDKVIEKEKRQG
ncbi:MAG TPA: hypothetical protein VMR49_00365 [Candidatus Paceibacterota bacterium]|jgi:hypothetical protein|nr:hypothetical protein [Candidatus Paceibacterota bacterium]